MTREGLSVARRYARAVFEGARDKGCLSEVLTDLKGIVERTAQSPELKNLLDNPRISGGTLNAVLEELFSKRVHILTLTFLFLLVDQNRIACLPRIAEFFEQWYLADSGIMKVRLTSYQQMPDEQVAALRTKLEDHFQKTVEISQDVDADLLGGFKFRINDTVHDVSVQAQFKKFRQAVMAA